MLSGSQKTLSLLNQIPVSGWRWHITSCVTAENLDSFETSLEALTYYLACSKSLSLSVLLFELVLHCLNHLKITRRPSNYWKWVQSGASMSATVFSLSNTLTKMHQCNIYRGNERFSKKKFVAIILHACCAHK